MPDSPLVLCCILSGTNPCSLAGTTLSTWLIHMSISLFQPHPRVHYVPWPHMDFQCYPHAMLGICHYKFKCWKLDFQILVLKVLEGRAFGRQWSWGCHGDINSVIRRGRETWVSMLALSLPTTPSTLLWSSTKLPPHAGAMLLGSLTFQTMSHISHLYTVTQSQGQSCIP